MHLWTIFLYITFICLDLDNYINIYLQVPTSVWQLEGSLQFMKLDVGKCGYINARCR